jgi:hypothetical protein
LIGQRQNLAWAIFCPPFSWCQNVSLISSLFAFEKHLPLILTPKVFLKNFVLGDLCIGIITTFFWSQKCERMWVVKIIEGLSSPNFTYIMGCWFLATSTLGLRLLTWTINNVISVDMLYKLYNMLNWVRWGREGRSKQRTKNSTCVHVCPVVNHMTCLNWKALTNVTLIIDSNLYLALILSLIFITVI